MAAIVEPRTSAKAASASATVASSSADGALSALLAAVATQDSLIIFPSHTKSINSDKSKMTSAEATKLARENLARFTGEQVPAPHWDDGMDTSDRKPLTVPRLRKIVGYLAQGS